MNDKSWEGENQALTSQLGRLRLILVVYIQILVDVYSQSEWFRVMPNVIMSTMNFSFAQPAQADKKCQPQAWDTSTPGECKPVRKIQSHDLDAL